MLKLHMHTMHLCTRHNNVETVIANVSRMFADTAERCFNYIRCLSQTKKPSTALIISKSCCNFQTHQLFCSYARFPDVGRQECSETSVDRQLIVDLMSLDSVTHSLTRAPRRDHRRLDTRRIWTHETQKREEEQ